MAKTEGQNSFFFSPGPDNRCAQRTRNRDINHCALTGAKKKIVSTQETWVCKNLEPTVKPLFQNNTIVKDVYFRNA